MFSFTPQADAKVLVEDLIALLCASFPAPEDEWIRAEQADGLTLIARLEQAASMIAGAQRIAMVGLVTDQVTYRDPGTYVHDAERTAHADTALALGVCDKTACGRIAEARALHERLPATLAALRAGEITVYKSMILYEETVNLDRPECARVEAKVLPGAGKQKPGALRRKTRSVVERIDSEAAVKRRERARRERELVTYEQPDGMNAVNALLPAQDAAALWAVIDAHAKSLRLPGDERTIGALRADALVDIVVNGNGTRRVDYQVKVIVPVGTVLGIGNDPGHIPGHGPIPADITRMIAADTEWQRLLTDPDTGHLLDANPTKYKPGAHLDEYIRQRDQHCRWPNCGQPAHRADVDHTIPHPAGPTVRRNLGVFCRRHHQVKQSPGWKVAQGENGEITFTTPTGRVYRTRPPNPDGTEHPVEEL